VDVKTTCVQSIDTCMVLREDVWAHNTSLTWPCFIEVPVLGQESEQSCSCVFGYRFCFVSIIQYFYVLTIQYFMFWQNSILCSDNTVFYVLTIQYFMFWQYSILCSDNTVFYVLIIQYFILWQYSILCSDNRVFYVLTIQYYMFWQFIYW
jgi:hypothetical protein